MARSLLIFSAIILLFSACKKAEDTTSSEDILRSGQWKRNSMKSTIHGTTSDAFVLLPACIQDNALEFKVNYKGIEHRNTKCSGGDADEAPFDWEFTNSGKNLRIYNANETFGGTSPLSPNTASSVNADVLLLSDNQLSLRYDIYLQNAISQTLDTITVVDVFRR